MELVLITQGCTHVISAKNKGSHLISLKILLRTCTIKDRIFFKLICSVEDFPRGIFNRFKNYLAHVSSIIPENGDIVKISSIRPISKLKRWQVSQIIRENKKLG